MDVVADILASLRLTGGIVLNASACGDWHVTAQLPEPMLAQHLPAGSHVVAFHYVRLGRVWVQIGNDLPIEAPAGSVVILPRNEQHRMFTDDRLELVDAAHYLVGQDANGVQRFELDGPGDNKVEFYCGFLGMAEAHPLLDCLPPILAIGNIAASRGRWLDSNLALLSEQPGGEMVAKVAELLFAESVRSYVESLGPGEGGWLGALKDPAVARALAIIHTRYAEELDVETLAREAGVSRTVLGERFGALLGESPMRYCGKWRMRQAARMLREGKDSTANIAYAVGFNAEAAFNRAFKREYGQPPGAWKKQLAAEGRAAGGKPEDPQRILAEAVANGRSGHCQSSDGLPIGYSDIGEGFPLSIPAVWYHQCNADWSSPVWGHWLAEALTGHRLIRSDLRSTGSSGHHAGPWSLEQLTNDFVRVLDEVGVDQTDLMAFSHGGLVALTFAARHPERVRKIVLVGAYACGFGVRGDAEEVRRRNSLRAMSRVYKGGDDGTFAQMLGALYWPGARGETIDWLSARLKTVDRLDESLEDVMRDADLADLLGKISAPVLILHSRGDRVVPFACAEELAAGLPSARLVPLDTDNHVPIGTEPCWEVARRELRSFFEGEAALANAA